MVGKYERAVGIWAHITHTHTYTHTFIYIYIYNLISIYIMLYQYICICISYIIYHKSSKGLSLDLRPRALVLDHQWELPLGAVGGQLGTWVGAPYGGCFRRPNLLAKYT